jgi:hypothetical protein
VLTQRHRIARRILWVDSLGGLSVGVLGLALRQMLATWYGLPLAVFTAMGVANVFYGCCSLALAARLAWRRRPAVLALALANVAWAVVCGVLIWRFGAQVTALGRAVLVLEGLYVGGLGMVEWWVCDELLAGDVHATR